MSRESLNAFLTPERVAQIKAILNASELDRFQDMQAFLADPKTVEDAKRTDDLYDTFHRFLEKNRLLWHTWRTCHNANGDTYPFAQASACLKAAADLNPPLDPVDLSSLQQAIQNAVENGGASGYLEFHRTESASTQDLVQKILGTDLLCVTVPRDDGSVYLQKKTLPEAIECLRVHPKAVIRPLVEIVLTATSPETGDAKSLKMIMQHRSADPISYLFSEGFSRDLCATNPFVREYAFRALVDTFGIDPTADATFVTRRTVQYGGTSGKPGCYYILPGHPNRPGTTALLLSDRSDPQPFFWHCAGDEAEMRRLIQHHTMPIDDTCFESIGQLRATPLEPFVPPFGLNPFNDRRWFDPVVIRMHIQDREEAARFVAVARTTKTS
jgi:hypothetical protein